MNALLTLVAFYLLDWNSLAARTRSLLLSQLFLLCRSSHSLHSYFLLLPSYCSPRPAHPNL